MKKPETVPYRKKLDIPDFIQFFVLDENAGRRYNTYRRISLSVFLCPYSRIKSIKERVIQC